jgi:hypothetical protein
MRQGLFHPPLLEMKQPKVAKHAALDSAVPNFGVDGDRSLIVLPSFGHEPLVKAKIAEISQDRALCSAVSFRPVHG